MQHFLADLLAVLLGDEIGGDLLALQARGHRDLLAVFQRRILRIGGIGDRDGLRNFAGQIELDAVLEDRNAVDRSLEFLIALVKGHHHRNRALRVVDELKVLVGIVHRRILADGHITGDDGVIMAFADLEPRAHHGVEQRRGNLADAAARLLNINAVFDDRCILISLGCGALAGERVDGEFLSRLHDHAADRLSAQADIGVSVGIGGGGGGKGRQAFELGFERRLVHFRSGFRHRDGHSAVVISGIDRRLRRRLGCFLIDLQTVLPILIGKGGILDVKAGHGRVFRLAVDGLRAGVEHLGHIRQGIARFHGKLHRLGFDLFDLCKIFLTGAVSADLIGLIDHGSQIAARHQRHLESLVVILQRQAVLGKAQRLLDSFRRLLARHAA